MAVYPTHGLSLCAGIGGIDLGLRYAIGAAYRTVCYVEREAFCAGILAARMADGALDEAPIWDDLATFDGKPWRGVVDIVSAGYPCQPFSCAGRRGGATDPRHLWPHVARIIGACRPTFAFLENVPGHVSLGLRDVCADLRRLGYDVSAGIFSAAECGAPHLRQRLFILAADPECVKLWQQPRGCRRSRGGDAAQPGEYGAAQLVADSERQGKPQPQGGERKERRRLGDGGVELHNGWRVEPDVGRLVDGIPDRVDRLRALGNAVVPATAALAWQWLGTRLGASSSPACTPTKIVG